MARFTITIYDDDPNGLPGVDYGETVMKEDTHVFEGRIHYGK